MVGMCAGGKPRRMVHIDPGYGTVTLNAAFVPRVKPMSSDGAATLRHFMHVQLDNDGRVNLARNVWVQVQVSRVLIVTSNMIASND
jgi:hypothetical protein